VIPTHLADGITLYLQNVDLLEIAVVVAILLLELNSLAICLYLPAVLLHPFLDVNLDLLSRQQFAERVRLIRHHLPLIDLWRARSMNQSSLQCRQGLKPPYGGLRQPYLTKKSVLILLQTRHHRTRHHIDSSESSYGRRRHDSSRTLPRRQDFIIFLPQVSVLLE
jgi:hypothetical protein